MLAYIGRRLLSMIPTLFFISVITFLIIQLPPGDFFTTLQAEVAATGGGQNKEVIERLQEIYGLDQPLYVQYWRWIKGWPKLDFGWSLSYNAPVWSVVASKLAFTLWIGLLSLIFMVAVALPIGIYSATHQYSLGDHLLSAVGFFGLCLPGFLVALVWMFLGIAVLRLDVGGLYSREMLNAPWTLAKVQDYLIHLLPGVFVLGLSSTAQLQRIMRSSMLDVLGQQHITTARAKGLAERKVINKYAVRLAINPLISIMALEIPKVINQSALVGIVMMLPTLGPTFLHALLTQDAYLSGTILLVMVVLLLFSNLLADIVLAAVDPRIVYN
jgi:peptide/nickel transport system permease protein